MSVCLARETCGERWQLIDRERTRGQKRAEGVRRKKKEPVGSWDLFWSDPTMNI
jgi:hypothetical protein